MAGLTLVREESTPKIDQAILDHVGKCLRRECQQNGTAGSPSCCAKVRAFIDKIVGIVRVEKLSLNRESVHKQCAQYGCAYCIADGLKNN